MKSKTLSLATCFLTLTAAHAAPISWGTATTISGDADVSTVGTFDRAYNFGSAATVTVNGVLFTQMNANSATGITVSSSMSGNSSTFGSTAAPYVDLSANYKTLVGSGRFVPSASAGQSRTITLTNLTIGGFYDVQLWVNDSRSLAATLFMTLTAANAVNLDYNSTGANGGVGQFVIGRFVADSTSQAIVVSGTNVQFNALQLRTVVPPELIWTGAIDGDWDFVKANWTNGAPAVYSDGSPVVFNDTATNTAVNLTASLMPGGISVTTTVAKPYSFGGSGSLGGITGIIKNGDGVLTLENAGTNTFLGGVAINAGTFRLAGAADRLPATAAVTLADVAGATFDLNGVGQTIAGLTGGGPAGGNVTLGAAALAITGAGNFGGVISGPGSLAKTAAGTLTLSGENSFAGGTTISGGRLALANTSGTGLGSGPVLVNPGAILAIGAGGAGGSIAPGTLTNNGTLAFNRNADFTFSDPIQGSGGVTQENTANTVTLPAANSYTGPTVISNGALRVGHADALGATTAGTTINGSATGRLELTGGIAVPEPLTIATKVASLGTAPAVVNVSGVNNLTGPITLTSGGSFWTFRSDADSLIVSGTVTNIATTNTRTIRLSGEANGDFQSGIANSAANASITAISKEDGGTWTLSGTNTHTGATTVLRGTLLVAGSSPASPVNILPDGTLGGNGSVGPITSGGLIDPAGTLNAGATILEIPDPVISDPVGPPLKGILEIDVDGANSDRLVVTGNLNLAAATIRISGTPTAPSYTLATATTVSGSAVLESPVAGYILVIDATSVRLVAGSGTPYSMFTDANSLAGNNALPGSDPEFDGLSNLLEFVLGGNPNTNDSPSIRPTVIDGSSAITVTFNRTDASELQPVAVSVQVSPDLVTWNPADDILIADVNGSGPNGATYTVAESAAPDVITVTIPKNGATKKFARVRAVIP